MVSKLPYQSTNSDNPFLQNGNTPLGKSLTYSQGKSWLSESKGKTCFHFAEREDFGRRQKPHSVLKKKPSGWRAAPQLRRFGFKKWNKWTERWM